MTSWAQYFKILGPTKIGKTSYSTIELLIHLSPDGNSASYCFSKTYRELKGGFLESVSLDIDKVLEYLPEEKKNKILFNLDTFDKYEKIT